MFHDRLPGNAHSLSAQDRMTDIHQSAGETDDLLARGFYFIVVVWGERFCDYFLEYCLPSLLSPGNIPALRTRSPSKFLIATRPEDRERMRATAIFREMEKYVTPVFFEIPPCPPGRSGCEHMGVGHKLGCEFAFREKGYAMVLTPDCMLSEGSIGHLQELAKKGAKVVLAAALRFGEEPFLDNLRQVGCHPVREVAGIREIRLLSTAGPWFQRQFRGFTVKPFASNGKRRISSRRSLRLYGGEYPASRASFYTA